MWRECLPMAHPFVAIIVLIIILLIIIFLAVWMSRKTNTVLVKGAERFGSAGIYKNQSEPDQEIGPGTSARMALNAIALAPNTDDLVVGTETIITAKAGRYVISLQANIIFEAINAVASVGVAVNGVVNPKNSTEIRIGVTIARVTLYPSVYVILDLPVGAEISGVMSFTSGSPIGGEPTANMLLHAPGCGLYVHRIS